MDSALQVQLVKIFGNLAVEAAGQLEGPYGAAIARMGITEILALDAYINAKKYQEAKDLIRAKMTQQELADEASKLAELTFESAQTNVQGWNIAGALVMAGLRVLMFVALGLVGL